MYEIPVENGPDRQHARLCSGGPAHHPACPYATPDDPGQDRTPSEDWLMVWASGYLAGYASGYDHGDRDGYDRFGDAIGQQLKRAAKGIDVRAARAAWEAQRLAEGGEPRA